ncbi:hypothetical protein [Emcibacter sp.]|uniref:hypothetical protein n=1 Tax=Emcibacter sp. TaxID=1979954 RepID=UPI002AA7322C|nr:hypothetical protein [Emcibacter sp.]
MDKTKKILLLDQDLRFAVGVKEGRLSEVWTVFIGGDGSFYLTSTAIKKAMKLSVHHGFATLGFTKQAHEKYAADGFPVPDRRTLQRMDLPDIQDNHVVHILTIIMPGEQIRSKLVPWDKKKGVLYSAPPAKTQARFYGLFMTTSDEIIHNIDGIGEDAEVIGYIRHGPSRRVLCIATTVGGFDLAGLREDINKKSKGSFRRLTDELPDNGDRLGAVVFLARKEDQPFKIVEVSGMTYHKPSED